LDNRSLTILVVGPHRSGTSAVTLSLEKLGVELGGPLIPPMEENPRGFGELLAAMELDDALLGALGSCWDDPRPLPRGWQASPELAEFRPRVGEILKEDLCQAPVRALKDPRLCRLFPLWFDGVGELGCETVTLLVYRPPGEVARSLQAREGCSAERAWRIWAVDALGMLEAGAASQRYTWIGYHELLEDPEGTLAAVGESLGVDWPRPPQEASQDLRKLLSPSLRHQRVDLSPEDSAGASAPCLRLSELLASSVASRSLPDAEEIAAARGALEAEPLSPALFDELLTALARRTGPRIYRLERWARWMKDELDRR
jgi:hypothetical protein